MLNLHIGLPKTGSTFLQQRVAARAPGVMLVHRSQGELESAICMDLRRYVRANAVTAALLRARIQKKLLGLARQARADGRVMLVSAENISVHSIGFWNGSDPSPEHVAQRLAALAEGQGQDLAPVRVLIGLRRQDQWLASRYAESGKDLPHLSQTDFNRRLAEIAAAPELSDGQAWLDHLRVYESFATLLGKDNVHLFRLERIAKKTGLVMQRIGNFIGGPETGRAFRKAAAQQKTKRSNVLSTGDNIWRLRGSNSDLVLTPELQQAVLDRFKASNQRLKVILSQRENTNETVPEAG